VVRDGAWVGRVTSARWSRTLGKVVGLAWVPAAGPSDDATFRIEYGGTHVTAAIETTPFYDPEGTRLRS
jgi:sarcosine oxidase, subunit alpha